MAEQPKPWWKRAHDAISVARSVEWVWPKISAVVWLVLGTTWIVSDITILPLAWRVAITVGLGFLVSLVGLIVLGVIEARRRSMPSPESSGATRSDSAAASVSGVTAVPGMASVPLEEKRTDERVMINVDLEYVRSLFESHTSTQADQLLAPYLGKWTEVSGRVGDVSSVRGSARILGLYVRICFEYQRFAIPYATFTEIQMDFRDEKKFDRLFLLRRGDTIRVIGQIESVHSGTLSLNNCELLEPR